MSHWTWESVAAIWQLSPLDSPSKAHECDRQTRHYSIVYLGQVVYSHCLPSFTAPRTWGIKREFLAPRRLWWLRALL